MSVPELEYPPNLEDCEMETEENGILRTPGYVDLAATREKILKSIGLVHGPQAFDRCLLTGEAVCNFLARMTPEMRMEFCRPDPTNTGPRFFLLENFFMDACVNIIPMNALVVYESNDHPQKPIQIGLFRGALRHQGRQCYQILMSNPVVNKQKQICQVTYVLHKQLAGEPRFLATRPALDKSNRSIEIGNYVLASNSQGQMLFAGPVVNYDPSNYKIFLCTLPRSKLEDDLPIICTPPGQVRMMSEHDLKMYELEKSYFLDFTRQLSRLEGFLNQEGPMRQSFKDGKNGDDSYRAAVMKIRKELDHMLKAAQEASRADNAPTFYVSRIVSERLWEAFESSIPSADRVGTGWTVNKRPTVMNCICSLLPGLVDQYCLDLTPRGQGPFESVDVIDEGGLDEYVNLEDPNGPESASGQYDEAITPESFNRLLQNNPFKDQQRKMLEAIQQATKNSGVSFTTAAAQLLASSRAEHEGSQQSFVSASSTPLPAPQLSPSRMSEDEQLARALSASLHEQNLSADEILARRLAQEEEAVDEAKLESAMAEAARILQTAGLVLDVKQFKSGASLGVPVLASPHLNSAVRGSLNINGRPTLPVTGQRANQAREPHHCPLSTGFDHARHRSAAPDPRPRNPRPHRPQMNRNPGPPRQDPVQFRSLEDKRYLFYDGSAALRKAFYFDRAIALGHVGHIIGGRALGNVQLMEMAVDQTGDKDHYYGRFMGTVQHVDVIAHLDQFIKRGPEAEYARIFDDNGNLVLAPGDRVGRIDAQPTLGVQTVFLLREGVAALLATINEKKDVVFERAGVSDLFLMRPGPATDLTDKRKMLLPYYSPAARPRPGVSPLVTVNTIGIKRRVIGRPTDDKGADQQKSGVSSADQANLVPEAANEDQEMELPDSPNEKEEVEETDEKMDDSEENQN